MRSFFLCVYIAVIFKNNILILAIERKYNLFTKKNAIEKRR